MRHALPGPRKALHGLGTALLLAFAAPAGVSATPYEFISVGEPIESEIRILDLVDSRTLGGRIRLPHLGIRPLQPIELLGDTIPQVRTDAVSAVGVARLERYLDRDRGPGVPRHPVQHSTPRLLDYGSDAQLFQVSVGLEGAGVVTEQTSRFASNSGAHGRIALGLDRLLAYSHYVMGKIDDAQRFADPIIPHNDFIVLTEETYLSYTQARGAWSTQFGRSRWHLGPGEEGSLVLSKTSVGSSRVDLQACKLEYSIVSPK